MVMRIDMNRVSQSLARIMALWSETSYIPAAGKCLELYS